MMLKEIQIYSKIDKNEIFFILWVDSLKWQTLTQFKNNFYS